MIRRLVLAGSQAALAATLIAAGASSCAAPVDSRSGQARHTMAITVDDLPVAPPGRHTLEQQERITRRLLEVLETHGAPAVGFVNESKLVADGRVDPDRVALLQRWLDAGQDLGNHGHDHLDLHRVEPERWMADVIRGEQVIRPLVEAAGRELRWFRHPFLHTGRSPRVQRRTAEFLETHGYAIAPVTVDNGEWIYADAYADAFNRGDDETMARLGEDYVRYMLDVVAYYERQSLAITGEPIPQSLLIHAYALNADWLDPLLTSLEDRGTRWITLDEAVEHPAYSRPVNGYTGPGGISWLHRWAITDGVDPATFRGEPEVPGWVRKLSESGSAGPDTLSPARPMVVDRVEVRQLTSRVNGVDYELHISLPHGYEATDRRYPVVYTLDAGYSFLIARNITDHLAERGHQDEIIVVSIAYEGAEPGRSDDYRAHRTRDYTPTHSATGGYGPRFQEASGGGPRFLQVLETEIIPAVDRSYRTVPGRRILVGHSYGGLFTLWTMLTRPELFSGWIAVSPSIWYDDHHLLAVEEAYAEHHEELPGRAYLCVGSRERNSRIDMVRDLETLAGRLEHRGYQGLALDSRVMPDETHNSVFPGCLSNGLRFVLEGR